MDGRKSCSPCWKWMFLAEATRTAMPPSRWQSAARGKRTHPIVLRRRTTVPLYVFYLRPWAMSISFVFFNFARGRRTFSLYFLASPTGDGHSFYVFYLRPRAMNVLFTFFSFARGRQAFFFCFTIFRAVGRAFFFRFPLIRLL